MSRWRVAICRPAELDDLAPRLRREPFHRPRRAAELGAETRPAAADGRIAKRNRRKGELRVRTRRRVLPGRELEARVDRIEERLAGERVARHRRDAPCEECAVALAPSKAVERLVAGQVELAERRRLGRRHDERERPRDRVLGVAIAAVQRQLVGPPPREPQSARPEEAEADRVPAIPLSASALRRRRRSARSANRSRMCSTAASTTASPGIGAHEAQRLVQTLHLARGAQPRAIEPREEDELRFGGAGAEAVLVALECREVAGRHLLLCGLRLRPMLARDTCRARFRAKSRAPPRSRPHEPDTPWPTSPPTSTPNRPRSTPTR